MVVRRVSGDIVQMGLLIQTLIQMRCCDAPESSLHTVLSAALQGGVDTYNVHSQEHCQHTRAHAFASREGLVSWLLFKVHLAVDENTTERVNLPLPVKETSREKRHCSVRDDEVIMSPRDQRCRSRVGGETDWPFISC